MQKTIGITLLIATMSIVCVSCSKDDGSSSGNSTNGKTTAVFNPDVTYGTMTDQDGNVYKTLTIGTQTWMAENLRTTKYNDGTAIPNITDGDEWSDLTTGAYCNYNNTKSIVSAATFGRLYNWYAINTGKLAPEGWHVATEAEWTELTDYLGGVYTSSGKLKEAGTTHWFKPNLEATNESGFTALPGGYRYSDGTFGFLYQSGYFWTSSEEHGWPDFRYMVYHDGRVYTWSVSIYKVDGFSIRCVKD